MQIGSLVGSLVVVALTGIISRQKRLTLAALVASQVAFWSAKWVKGLVGRGRPNEYISNIVLREHATGLGYASGHTAVAFALAAVLGPVPAPQVVAGAHGGRRGGRRSAASTPAPTCRWTSSVAPGWGS